MKVGFIQLFKKIKFTKEGDSYSGKPANRGKGITITFSEDDDGHIVCKDIDASGECRILFTIDNSISIGTFICMLQGFGIVHERYIYESVDYIEEVFFDDDDDDDDEEDEY